MRKQLYLFWIVFLLGCQSLDKQKTEAVMADVWGEAGAISYPRSRDEMVRKHPNGQPLDIRMKTALSVAYGNLVEKVTIHWNATPLNELVSNQYGIRMIGEEAIAQAFGYDIFIRNNFTDWPIEQLIPILVHEIKHVQQYETYNSLSDFGYQYFKKYYEAGQSYAGNYFEIDAERAAETYRAIVLERWKSYKS